MKKLIAIACLIASLFTFNQCGQEVSGTDYLVTIKTDQGEMMAILYDETPKHKENFIKLAKEKYFDSLLFHRVIEGFMIQGGDPDSKRAMPGQPLGMGSPGYTVEAEFNSKFFHEKGALSAARLPDEQNPSKASSGSQFYIVQGRVVPASDSDAIRINQAQLNAAFQRMLQNTANQPLIDTLNQIYMSGDMQAYQKKIYSLVPRWEKEMGMKIYKEVPEAMIEAYTTVGGAPHLDGEYTVFGKVISGLEVIDKIAALPRHGNDRPQQDVRMTVTVEEVPRKKITEQYGYQYPRK